MPGDAAITALSGSRAPPTADDLASIRVRQPNVRPLSPDLELITSDDAESFPVRFEYISGRPPAAGRPSFGDGGPALRALRTHAPGAGVVARTNDYQRAVVVLLERFLRRYRAFQAYGQHL